jgi:alkanesulfonate monooxygenase SsuD/methylene tetrahydromethanopterin reductase-like flavin-dependent oxidoreductase (luciferase family)
MGAAPHDIWPLSGEYYSGDAAVRSMQTTFDQFRCADEFGFDWVTVVEHHYSAFSLTPNPMVMAGALSNCPPRQDRGLGADPADPEPVRVAEEFAMLDTMSGGRLVAGVMRGTSNEYVTYDINLAESRERFAEGAASDPPRLDRDAAFRLAGRYYQYRTISIWPGQVQQPHPPLYMSGSSPEAGEFAARNHIGRRNEPVCAGQLPTRFPKLPLRQGTDCYPRHPSLHR